MSGRKVVEAGSLNVTDVIGPAVFLASFWRCLVLVSVSSAGDPWSLRGAANFPRNLARVSVLYIAERPELSSPWRAGARECGMKVAMMRIQRRPKQERKQPI
jgi:hypothetical protein